MNKVKGFFSNLLEILLASLKGIGSVVRTQLILSAVTFVVLCAGLVLIGIPWWGLIAFLIALFDSIPVVGSGMVMIPWAVVRLIMGATSEGLYLLILYAVVFIARQILDPVINGRHIGVKPIYTLLSTVVFTLLLGPWGLLLGSVFAIVVKTVLEIRDRNKRLNGQGDTEDRRPDGAP